MVTAELAVAIPAMVVVLAVCLGAVGVGIDQIRCVDAARLGARALARGDAPTTVRDLTGRAAPTGAAVALGGDESDVRVAVSVHRSVWGLGGEFDLVAVSVAGREQQP